MEVGNDPHLEACRARSVTALMISRRGRSANRLRASLLTPSGNLVPDVRASGKDRAVNVDDVMRPFATLDPVRVGRSRCGAAGVGARQ